MTSEKTGGPTARRAMPQSLSKVWNSKANGMRGNRPAVWLVGLLAAAAGLGAGAPAVAVSGVDAQPRISVRTHEAAAADGPVDRVTEQCLQQIRDLAVQANLRYLTRTAERKPTLYFVAPDGIHTVRVRQEHRRGAVVKAYPGAQARFRLFFQNADDQGFLRGLASGLSALPGTQPGRFSAVPVEGWHQMEYSTKDNLPDGEVRRDRHFSGGVVSLDLTGYTQEVINTIIAGIPKKKCKS